MSAQKHPVLVLTRKAGATLTKYQAITAAGAVVAAGAAAFGFVTTDASTGDDIAVDVLGTTIATAGAAVSDGALLEVGSAGKLITKTTGVAVARALQGAASNEPFEVLILPATT